MGPEGWCVGVGEFSKVLSPGVPDRQCAHCGAVDVADGTGNVPGIKIFVPPCLVRSYDLRVVNPPSSCLRYMLVL